MPTVERPLILTASIVYGIKEASGGRHAKRYNTSGVRHFAAKGINRMDRIDRIKKKCRRMSDE
jgi:hypothetical protein